MFTITVNAPVPASKGALLGETCPVARAFIAIGWTKVYAGKFAVEGINPSGHLSRISHPKAVAEFIYNFDRDVEMSYPQTFEYPATAEYSSGAPNA